MFSGKEAWKREGVVDWTTTRRKDTVSIVGLELGGEGEGGENLGTRE